MSHHPPRILVIINPAAGQDDAAESLEKISASLTRSGSDFEIRETAGEGDALGWAREADGFDRVVVGGGDGTVMEVMTGLIENKRQIPLAQLPLGTANLLARALAVPPDLDDALELAVGGVVVAMDVGHLPSHDRYFALVAGSGWDAQLIDDASREMKDHFGFFAYLISGVKNLFSLERSKVRITIEGRTRRFTAHTVLVINVGEIYGSGIALGDHLNPHDGRLDLAIASSRSLWGITKLVFKLVTKCYDGSPDLRYFSAGRFEISADPPLKLEIDGEPIGHTPFTVEVVPDGVHLVVPQAYADAKGLGATGD